MINEHRFMYCDHCGKRITKASTKKETGRHFCNKLCHYAWMEEKHQEKENGVK